MAEDARQDDPRAIRTVKPGDRVIRRSVRKRRVPLIERSLAGPLEAAAELAVSIVTQTPVLPIMAVLAILVFVAPLPVYLFERGVENGEVTSYWIGLWWAVSAFSTAGHSDVVLQSSGGRIVGSVYTVLSVGLFFGSVLAAFSSYFMLTWRQPKRMVTDTVTYYLQRLDQLTAEEIEDLDDITRGLLQTAKERAEREDRHSEPPDDSPASTETG